MSQQPAQQIELLGLDRVTFERHGRRPYLMCPEWLTKLAERGRLEQAQVESKFIQRATQPGQGAGQKKILLAWVDLRRNVEEWQVEPFRQPALETLQFFRSQQLGI